MRMGRLSIGTATRLNVGRSEPVQSILKAAVVKRFPIEPGHGRWTITLRAQAGRLVAADLSGHRLAGAMAQDGGAGRAIVSEGAGAPRRTAILRHGVIFW